jgi:glycosyltransferase involved in cell wall biosynthesis
MDVNSEKKVLFIAGFPPPASGQLIMQKKMYDLISAEDKKLISLNFTSSSRDFSKTSIKKVIKLINIILKITKEGLFAQRKIDKVYYSLSGPKKSALVKDILIGIPLNLFFKKKLILQVHAGGYNQTFVESKFLFSLLQRLYVNLEHLLCLTEFQKKELDFLKAKIKTTVYNFCEDVASDRKESSANSNGSFLRLLSVGHLNPNKGIEECIMLAAMLKDQDISFKWKFIGSFQDRAFELKIRDMIPKLNIADHIVIENEMPNHLILNEYTNADFLVFLSNGPEGQPVVLIEALMMANAIIIAKDVCGIGEYVKSGYNGFLVDDYKDVLTILTDHDKRKFEAMRANARRTYVENFSVEKFSKKVSVIFEKPFGIN